MADPEEELKAEVLADLRGDDLPLHLVWFMAGRFVDLKLSERLALAESVVVDLLEGGDVQLKKGTWTEWPTDKTAPITGDEIASVLREYTAWVPQQEPMYFLST